jgi:PBP superfamily domain
LKLFHSLTAAGLLAMAAAAPAGALDISGAGATFPYPIYAKWADVYKKETGVGMNYQSIGSGGGIKQIEAKTVTFGATDAPLKGEDLDKNGLVQFPMVMGGIVPVWREASKDASAAAVATSVASGDGLPKTVFTSLPVFSNSIFAIEKAPTSQPARVNGTHGAGCILPRWSTICGTFTGLVDVPSFTRSVQ